MDGSEPVPLQAGGQETIPRILRDRGYVEGKNIAFEYRFADNKVDRLPALADELLRLKVDVLVTPGISEALVAKNATKTIPIVFFSAVDPVAAGLIDSLPRPGESHGVHRHWGGIGWQAIGTTQETVPKLSRVAVLWDPQNPSSAQQWKESQLAARELGFCSFIPWKSVAPTNTRAPSKRLLRRVAPRSPRRQSKFANSNQKQIADLANKKPFAGNLPSGRLGRQWWPDVVRARPRRTL